MDETLLRNPGFEEDWDVEGSHRCLVFPKDGGAQEIDVGNVFTPVGWVTWFYHDPDTLDQPEVRDAWAEHDARRVHGGQKGMLLFTFHRKHDAGFLQQVRVVPGTRLRLTAWAHAWSNWHDGLHPSDSGWSDGPGYEAGFCLEGGAQDDTWRNFTFYVGIDSTGGTNPFAKTVVWGQGAHIYNVYAQVPAVEAVAQGDVVTVFLRSKTLWAFKHNDAYWDDVELVQVGPDPEPEPEPDPEEPRRGQPRVQYKRTVLLLFPGAGKAWAMAAVDATWNNHRYTIGGSADDAGLGNLDNRRVIAVNPSAWGSDLAAFFQEHYSGVVYVPVEAASPQDLERLLLELDDPGDPPPQPEPEQPGVLRVGLHDEPGGHWLAARLEGKEIESCCLVHEIVREDVRRLDFSALANAGTKVLCRLNWGYADGGGTVPPPDLAQVWVAAMRGTIEGSLGVAGWIIGNEQNNPSEWPGGYPDISDIITPGYYVLLYNAICVGFDSTSFSPGPLDPYNVVAGEFGVANDPADWAAYIYDHIDRCDFITMHAKTQGGDPAECWSLDTFSHPPLVGRRLHLRTVEDQRLWIPPRFLDRPVCVTEVNPQRRRNGEIGWDSDGAEWIRQACAYFRGLGWVSDIMFYRFQIAGEQAPFALEDKPDILTEVERQALSV